MKTGQADLVGPQCGTAGWQNIRTGYSSPTLGAALPQQGIVECSLRSTRLYGHLKRRGFL